MPRRKTPDDAISPSCSKTCCMWMVLSHQADFLAEKPHLQTVIEAAGHKCHFLPKFHCEFNPIEMHWGWVKIHEYLAHSTLLESLILILGLCALANGTFLTAKRFVLSSWIHAQQCHLGILLKSVALHGCLQVYSCFILYLFDSLYCVC